MKKLIIPIVAAVSLMSGMLIHKTLLSSPEPLPGTMGFFNITPAEAHAHSARFRQDANYCGSGDCKSKEGIFDLSELTVYGLSQAVDDIKAKTAGKQPSGYRCIFGQDGNGETVIIVVGTDINRNEYGTEAYMRRVNGTLPCPTLCDINKSKVVMGDPLKGQDCCN
jgi:hypothetical protein